MTARGWQPIETAPRDGTHVDLWVGGERIPDCRWLSGRWEEWWDLYGWAPTENQPTHWMPLPDPPGCGPEEPGNCALCATPDGGRFDEDCPCCHPAWDGTERRVREAIRIRDEVLRPQMEWRGSWGGPCRRPLEFQPDRRKPQGGGA